MSDLISRSALLEEVKSLTVTVMGLRAGKGVLHEYAKQYRDTLLRIIDEQPAIEAIPVVHGEIVTVFEKAIGHQRCSVCGNELEWKAYPNYCDNCGAKIDSKKT